MKIKKRLLAGLMAVCLLAAGLPVDLFSTGKTVLAKEKAGTVIDVTDFGADPGGKRTVQRRSKKHWKKQRKQKEM